MLTIGVDVDGVVADLCTAWLNRYNKEYDDNLIPANITAWNTHIFVKPECGIKIYKYIEDPSLYDNVFPTSPEALVGINRIKAEGHKVIYITTSTLGASGAKFKWLEKWGFVENMMDYVEATDKNLINADILIDDKPEGCKRWYEAARLPVLFKQPWNTKEIVPYYHTCNWDIIFQAVLISNVSAGIRRTM